MVTVGPEFLEQFSRFSLYNSPYTAHEDGCAIDLYPHSGEAVRSSKNERGGTTRESGDYRDSSNEDGARETAAPSPVAGEVVATRSVSAPPKPYAVEDDHLIVVDTGSGSAPSSQASPDDTGEHLARILHVEPAVEPGDEVAVGDSLGEMVRSGFFAPWVDNHIHLGFRPPDANPFRASGSLPVEVDPSIGLAGVPWDGRGEVVAAGETYAILDAPNHPAPGKQFAGITADGVADGRTGILDGGLPHYDGGGVFSAGGDGGEIGTPGPVSLAGQRVGTAEDRTITWDDLTVLANGTPITGLSLFFAREELGAKLVCPNAEFEVGEAVEVEFR